VQAANAIDQKIGDLYGSCMDEKNGEHKGIAPLQPELDRVACGQGQGALIDEIARRTPDGAGSAVQFLLELRFAHADMVIAYIDQGGLSLPDRDYYIKDDAAHGRHAQALRGLRDRDVHSGRTVACPGGGFCEQRARIETALAKDSMDRTVRRDPKTRDHKMQRDQAVALAPDLYLNRYFVAIGAPALPKVNVGNPRFFQASEWRGRIRTVGCS